MINRQFEREHLLCAMLMRSSIQAPYLILQAWNIELSRTRTASSLANPSVVAGKFSFWRDVINGQPTQHPIGLAMTESIRQYNWPTHNLKEFIDAKVHQLLLYFLKFLFQKERDSHRKLFYTTEELEQHYRLTEGNLAILLVKSFIQDPDGKLILAPEIPSDVPSLNHSKTAQLAPCTVKPG